MTSAGSSITKTPTVALLLLGLAAAPIAEETVELRVGESAAIGDTGLELTFVEVTRDSRCPVDVTCVRAGEAVVVLRARLDGDESELTFEVPPGGSDEQELGHFTVTVAELEPEAVSTTKIDASEYVAHIVVAEPDSP